jgi:hypothetical protein
VDEEGVVQSRNATPAFGFSILQNLKGFFGICMCGPQDLQQEDVPHISKPQRLQQQHHMRFHPTCCVSKGPHLASLISKERRVSDP